MLSKYKFITIMEGEFCKTIIDKILNIVNILVSNMKGVQHC